MCQALCSAWWPCMELTAARPENPQPQGCEANNLGFLVHSRGAVSIHETGPVFKCQTAFSSVQSLSRVRLFVTPWTAACHAFLSITNSRSLLKLMSIKSVMPSNHLILFHPLLLLPSILPSIRVFSNESVLRIRWPKYWSFNFNISPSNEGLFSNTTVQKHQFFSTQLSS